MYKKARQLQLKLQNYRGVGRCHRKFAGVYRVSGDYVRAADALETAAEYLRGIDDPLELAPFEFEQGALHAANSEHSAAVQALRRALAGFQELGQQADVTKTYHYLIASYQANGDFRSALDCMREMGLQQASMWAVLVKDLHPSVARECESSFASGRFQDAVSAAFSAVENELRTRAARLEHAPETTADISRVMATWFGPPEDTLESRDTRPVQHQFCKAAFELFRNPTPPNAFGVEPTEAFAQIAVAHLIAGIITVKSPDDLARS
jgi:pentatricopeptide repeat protein